MSHRVRKNAHNLWFPVKKHTFILPSVTGTDFCAAVPKQPGACLSSYMFIPLHSLHIGLSPPKTKCL